MPLIKKEKHSVVVMMPFPVRWHAVDKELLVSCIATLGLLPTSYEKWFSFLWAFVKKNLAMKSVCCRRRQAHLLHVAAKFGIRRLVHSVPIHGHFDLLIKLEDDQSISQVPVTHTHSIYHSSSHHLADMLVGILSFLTHRDGWHEDWLQESSSSYGMCVPPSSHLMKKKKRKTKLDC